MKIAKQNNEIVVMGRLKDISEKEFKGFLLKEYHKLLLKNGQNPPSISDAVMITNELYNNLKTIWPGIKTEWISSSFNNGINGEYGEFANISYRLMVEWINKYKAGMKRKDFAMAEEPMSCKERSTFVLDGLRKRNPDIFKLDKKGTEALKRKLNN